MRKYQEIIMTIKDERMKIMNEILNGIKVVKLSGWELMFIKKVLDVRERELKIYFKYCILAGFESFTWHVANIWVFINLEVEPGKLIAVVGPVGCGKSSMLAAMLGEMYKLNGYFNLNSSVAYVPQQAWIQNNTLKENILFGKKYDEQFFNQVINACALTPDLDIMPAGADTEIGEKGINLSGGQKQRVSLARAAYSQADIYLLDDSLSAVDSHVGKHIFDNMLGKEGLLSGKTRVLVTHGIYWLPFVDQILVMSDGRIIESGTYDGLLSHNGPFAKFLVQYLTQNNEFDKASQKQINVIDQEVKRDILRRLVSVTSEGDGSVFSEQLTKKSDALEVNISTSTLFGSCQDFDDFQSSETLSGTSVIRAYQVQDMFIADSLKKVDTFQKSYLAYKGLNRWLEARLGLVTLIISITATILAVKFKDDLSPGLVGLAVTYALRISNDMTVLTLTFGNLENHIVSLERIIEYSTIKSEAAWECHNVTSMWPTHGSIEFINYSTRYRDGMFLVLRNINCVIHGGEKIGIVGRTGAGKSSMMLSLLRLLEAAEGKITIDGVDIATLGLHTLRKNLTILPQDPVLFAGSIRMNLDPFNEKTDSEIWQVLENTHMKTYIESLPFKLEYEVGEGGQNLSMGQRQLLCLTRALLKKSNIFILDEATAAVDMETDEFIQKRIKEEFIGCTVLTIAHRINTVMDYDRIMVLEEGQVVEFDSPRNLLQREDSLFYFMATQAGLI
ncbi:Multidrug resistance-associated protein 1 [Bulinus truncatus]|nr:Multidrug resistance-associated protein 1 [Bulinus truncatus]